MTMTLLPWMSYFHGGCTDSLRHRTCPFTIHCVYMRVPSCVCECTVATTEMVPTNPSRRQCPVHVSLGIGNNNNNIRTTTTKVTTTTTKTAFRRFPWPLTISTRPCFIFKYKPCNGNNQSCVTEISLPCNAVVLLLLVVLLRLHCQHPNTCKSRPPQPMMIRQRQLPTKFPCGI